MNKGHEIILTSVKTRKERRFRSSIEASYFLSRSKSYVSTCISHGLQIKHGYTGEKFVVSYPENAPKRSKEQPCCTCKKACFGCSWSRNFQPVEGWTAIPTIITHGDRQLGSYQILNCPEYERG